MSVLASSNETVDRLRLSVTGMELSCSGMNENDKTASASSTAP